MGPLDLVEDYDLVGPCPEFFGQPPAIVVSHITRRSADQFVDSSLLRILAHIEPEDALFAVVEEFPQGVGKKLFSGSPGTGEEKGGPGSLFIDENAVLEESLGN